MDDRDRDDRRRWDRKYYRPRCQGPRSRSGRRSRSGPRSRSSDLGHLGRESRACGQRRGSRRRKWSTEASRPSAVDDRQRKRARNGEPSATSRVHPPATHHDGAAVVSHEAGHLLHAVTWDLHGGVVAFASCTGYCSFGTSRQAQDNRGTPDCGRCGWRAPAAIDRLRVTGVTAVLSIG